MASGGNPSPGRGLRDQLAMSSRQCTPVYRVSVCINRMCRERQGKVTHGREVHGGFDHGKEDGYK